MTPVLVQVRSGRARGLPRVFSYVSIIYNVPSINLSGLTSHV